MVGIQNIGPRTHKPVPIEPPMAMSCTWRGLKPLFVSLKCVFVTVPASTTPPPPLYEADVLTGPSPSSCFFSMAAVIPEAVYRERESIVEFYVHVPTVCRDGRRNMNVEEEPVSILEDPRETA